MRIILYSLLLHTVLFYAALELYFSSPIDHGMTPILSTDFAPSRRIVLMIADGLRAEAIYGANEYEYAPELTHIRHARASWGVAHTRVPTESRPGHVAILAGIYEDPAAILRGWTAFPVTFDSVLNQSSNAFCWGSPDVLNLFKQENHPRIRLNSYDPKLEDFGAKNTTLLDLWVFKAVEDYINELRDDDCSDCMDFDTDGNIFFLHLLGMDTVGHGFKPGSPEYIENIKFVDSYIPHIEELFERTYVDKKTTYIFASDHGMTNWGSHGSGSDHETQTPFIAWGAGIKQENVQKDLNQIDIAPLMSALMGLNYPINSLGILPYNYIDAPTEVVNGMLWTNMEQLYQTYSVKLNRTKNNAIRFIPYMEMDPEKVFQMVENLSSLLDREDFEKFREECKKLMEFLIKAMDYYHNYYQLPILIAITVGLACWIIYLATYNVRARASSNAKTIVKQIHLLVYLPVYAQMTFLLHYQSLPLSYYLYFMFPITTSQLIVHRSHVIIRGIGEMFHHGFWNAFLSVLGYLIGLRLLVLGFRQREAYGAVMVLVALSIFTSDLKRFSTPLDKIIWIGCFILLGSFTLLPTMQTKFSYHYYMGGSVFLWICVWRLMKDYIYTHYMAFCHSRVLYIQFFFIKLAPLYCIAIHYGWIPHGSNIKYCSWLLSFYPIILIFNSPRFINLRLTSLFLGFAPFYLMVSTSYEPIFLVFYVSALFIWLGTEAKCLGYDSIARIGFDHLRRYDLYQRADDFRRAFFFVAFIFIGFFGTGNIASVNTFDPMWVRGFFTLFNPFAMTALIVLKFTIPFVFTTCTYRAINHIRRVNTLNLFCLVLMFSDIMLLELIYYITNIGSWLEIGMSLSHFIIMEAFVFVLLLLYGLTALFCYLRYYGNLNMIVYRLLF